MSELERLDIADGTVQSLLIGNNTARLVIARVLPLPVCVIEVKSPVFCWDAGACAGGHLDRVKVDPWIPELTPQIWEMMDDDVKRVSQLYQHVYVQIYSAAYWLKPAFGVIADPDDISISFMAGVS